MSNARTHIENAARMCFPPTRQSITADVDDMRRELSLASAGLAMDNPDEAAILNRVFAADTQLRIMTTASERLAQCICELRGAVARDQTICPTVSGNNGP